MVQNGGALNQLVNKYKLRSASRASLLVADFLNLSEVNMTECKMNKLRTYLDEIEQFEMSGLSKKAWCEQNSFSIDKFKGHQDFVYRTVEEHFVENHEFYELRLADYPDAEPVEQIEMPDPDKKAIVIKGSELEIEISETAKADQLSALVEVFKHVK